MYPHEKRTDPLPEGFVTACATKAPCFPELFEIEPATRAGGDFPAAFAFLRNRRAETLAEVLEKGPDGKLEEVAARFPAWGKFTGTVPAQVVLGNDPLHDLPDMNVSVFLPAFFAEHGTGL
jgi:hypothetical protein